MIAVLVSDEQMVWLRAAARAGMSVLSELAALLRDPPLHVPSPADRGGVRRLPEVKAG